MRLLRSASLLHLLGRLHEEREDGPQAQDVYKLVAVVHPLGADHAMVQDLQCAGPRHLLLPVQWRRGRVISLVTDSIFSLLIF